MLRNIQSIITTVLQVLVAGAVLVHAGSYIWQPEITRYNHLGINTSSYMDKAAHNPIIRSLSEPAETFSSTINKRYLLRTIPLQQPWPNNNIQYCFATSWEKGLLKDWFKDAIKKWYTAGLDEEVFTTTEVDASECVSKRSTTLLIREREAINHASATIGFTPADPSIGFEGPFLNIVRSKQGYSRQQMLSLLAHDVGHIWGLLHEHQNPYFWKSHDGIENALGPHQGFIFHKLLFKCHIIINFEDAAQRAKAKYGRKGPQMMCRDQSVALELGFGASVWLPLSASLIMGTKKQDIDWDSIMLLPSRALVKEGTHKNKDKDKVLRKVGGRSIPFPSKVSEGDISGLNVMYLLGPRKDLPLLNQPGNRFSEAFQRIYGSTRDQMGCNNI